MTTYLGSIVGGILITWAVLVHGLAIAGAACAQETNRHVMVGIGIAPLSVTSTRSATEGIVADRSTTVTQASLGGKVLLAAGFGLGPWVLALETAFSHWVAREEQDESSFDEADFVTKRSELTFGPSGRLLFIEGAVRPYVELGAGFGLLLEDADGATDSGTTLYVRGGPGVQLRLTDAASLDLTLRAGYAATSGDLEVRPFGARYNATTGLYQPIYPTSSVEYDVHEITADIAARLSIWL